MAATNCRGRLKLNKCLSFMLSLTTFLGVGKAALCPAGLNGFSAAPALAGSTAARQAPSELYDRVDWQYCAKNTSTAFGDKSTTAPVLGMGMDEKGQLWKANWDRINSEAAFMYILAIGAREHALPASAWTALRPCNQEVAGVELAGGDRGLFSFQYSNELADLKAYRGNKIDLYAQSIKAAKTNHDYCLFKAPQFKTFQHLWGL